MVESPITAPPLEPLGYHRLVVDQLREDESRIWEWAQSQQARDEHDSEMRSVLLRETYRLEPAAHPEVHEDIAGAMAVLDLDAPLTLYQASDGAMNAALCYIPGEVHLVFYGPVLEKLTRPERIALIGHELAHYRLWSIDGGQFHVATRILDHALAYSGNAPSHVETARVYRLHTELYADRGGAIAADATGPAIATLVKTMTGLNAVDSDAYLRQAAELEGEEKASHRETHPEVFLRALALDKWWRGEAGLDAWIDRRVRGPMALGALDLPRQRELTALTRGFLARLLAKSKVESEAVTSQIRRMFPDWTENETQAEDDAFAPDRIDDSVRNYLAALTFDVAFADPELRDDLLLAGARLAGELGAAATYRAALKRDLRMSRQAIDRLLAPLVSSA